MSAPAHLHPRPSGLGLARPLRRSLGALISLMLFVVSGYYWLTFHNIEKGLTTIGGLHVGRPVAPVATGSAAPSAPAKAVNILIVGNDDRINMTRKEQLDLHVGAGQGSNSTDTMMLVHIPADGSRATLISIPRDSWVDIPGYGWGKLNGAYVDAFNATNGSHLAKVKAGANKLIDVVSGLVDQPIDHYIQIGLLGFYRIANALNGIPVTLCNNVDDQNSGFRMTKGRHVLNGKEALAFVRQRYNFPDGRGDLDRVRRQQYFLTAAFRQVASVGILTELKSLGDAIQSSMYFDGNFSILDLAKQVEKLTANNIRGVTIPTSFATIDGQDVLQLNLPRVRSFVAQALGQVPSTPSSSTPGTSTSPTAPSNPASSSPTKAIDASCVN